MTILLTDPFTTNITAVIGTNEGWHEVWVGLRGRLATSQQTWTGTRIKLDRTPPLLVLTNLATGTVSQPMIQLQGYSAESLMAITYDITNAAGLITNDLVVVLDRYYDTNVCEFTTNVFQAFDIRLTNGLNIITLRATDLAGNVTTTNFSFTLDYSSDTNAPVVAIYWPEDGAHICGSNFTWRGWVDDLQVDPILWTTERRI
ncbi:MAG: hypothetical protein KIS67_05335 [Verrucomicrobiae bacterium]|nr:hypothetical protein [Verrucomicrobiae bacterium]